MDNVTGEIRQGFLCPFCMQDLHDVSRLQEHVQDVHPENNDNAIDYLKGVFDKAKQRLFDLDLDNLATSAMASVAGSSETSKLLQNTGQSTSHTKYFFSCRESCINDIALQTNNLIIRLDKLVNELPENEAERKDFEKKTVPWSENSDYPNCRVCNAKFSITRRKHHCRLCGKIMCNNCSRYLPIISARKLTNPAFAANMLSELNEDVVAPHKPTRKRISIATIGADSLEMVKRKTEKEPSECLRICGICKDLLDRREEVVDTLSAPTLFVDVYDKMCQMLTEITNLTPSYRRMAESLGRGESKYTLKSAEQLRKKLISVQREITSLSERIEQWGLQNDPAVQRKPGTREILLHRNIRNLAISMLQEAVANIPDLPSDEEYADLVRTYKEKAKQELRALKERHESQRLTSSLSNAALSTLDSRERRSESPLSRTTKERARLKTSASFSGLKTEEGWTPECSSNPCNNPFDDDQSQMHPVQQQYINVKSFLKQAAQAGRLEEVDILEKSLLDIEVEMKKLDLPTPRAE
ncbi:FYVE zinc finger family protein [Aphelenchoides avenae]|nr:FYVE zinc finger family protein [Aphelenchus avenae]